MTATDGGEGKRKRVWCYCVYSLLHISVSPCMYVRGAWAPTVLGSCLMQLYAPMFLIFFALYNMRTRMGVMLNVNRHIICACVWCVYKFVIWYACCMQFIYTLLWQNDCAVDYGYHWSTFFMAIIFGVWMCVVCEIGIYRGNVCCVRDRHMT